MLTAIEKFLPLSAFVLVTLISSGVLADTEGTSSGAAASADKAQSAECREFAKDPDANLGKVLKAGCEPTLAKMSALTDNLL